MSAPPKRRFELSSLLVPAAERLPSNAAYLVHLEILVKNPGLIRLQSNENTQSPSPRVKQALAEAFQDANLYPSPLHPLRDALASRHNLGIESVKIGAGATEPIEATLRTFVRAGDHVVLPSPTWPVYHRRLTALEASVTEVPLHTGEHAYSFAVESMLDAITPETKMVVLVTPNNPTGNLMGEADVRRFLDKGCMVLLDQAYRDFAPDNDLTALVHEYENLGVALTFAKAYNLAGLRLGYILAAPTVIDYVDRFMVPGGGVSAATLRAGLAALEDEEYHQQQVDRIIAERERFIGKARGMGLQALDSGGNFFAVDVSSYPGGPEAFFSAVMEQGVLIRPLTGGIVRITIGTRQENDIAIRALQTVLEATEFFP